LGTSEVDKIFDIEIDFKIVDLCYVKSVGCLVAMPENHCVGKIGLDGNVDIPWIGQLNEQGNTNSGRRFSLLNSPLSLLYNQSSNEVFIFEKYGTVVKKIDLSSEYVISLTSGTLEAEIQKYFPKDIKEEVVIDSAVDKQGGLFFVNSYLNRCFSLETTKIIDVMGSGKAGYSVANNLTHSLLNAPSGIVNYNGIIYISDRGNHCIRELKNNSSFVFAGNVGKDGSEDGRGQECLLSCPTKMVLKNDIIYFIDKDKVKYLSIADKSVGTIYKSNNIISIDIDEERSVLILERNES